MSSFEDALSRLLTRIEELGLITDTPGALTRTFLSPANRLAARRIGEWMQAAGMEVAHDRGGTVRGILNCRLPIADCGSEEPGAAATDPSADPSTQSAIRNPQSAIPPLLLGSHIDTVIDAGKYDGALGVLIAIAALEATGPLDFPVHVLGFSDEEGVRFHATYLGSRACVGQLTQPILDTLDVNGISVRTALSGDVPCPEKVVKKAPETPPGLAEFHYAPGDARGYVEVHIEQGRCLEEVNEPVCAVSTISGQSRLLITLTGQSDHAGTTPIHLRRDALVGAAECVLAAQVLSVLHPPLLATVGKLEVRPGASNVIPGEVRFTLDFRHPYDDARERLLAELLSSFESIASTRDLSIASELVQSNAAVPCDPALKNRLIDLVEPITKVRRTLPSGAGHDAVMMATAMPVAMLFVRCRNGLSHHPDEYASPEDIAAALKVLIEFLKTTR